MPLILHVGMHKTGTSSVQETLFTSLKDRRFRYVGLGLVNGSRAIQCLVGDDPVVQHVHVAQGIGRADVERLRSYFRRCWERQVMRARRAGVTPIISAEDCWFLSRAELKRLCAMIESAGFQAHLIAYLRTPLAWLSSMFQELLKSGHHTFVDKLLMPSLLDATDPRPFGCDYLRQLAAFEEIFGHDNLTVRVFRRDALVDGCVVTDFCRHFGIAMPHGSIRRVNESLSLDVTRFLYTYNRLGRTQHNLSFPRFLLLLRRLQEFPGRPLRLHPAVLTPAMPLLQDQFRMLRARYGVELGEDWRTTDGEMIGREEDLFCYSQESLDWLAAKTGGARIDGRSGSDVAWQVNDQIGQPRPRFRHRVEYFLTGRLRQLRLILANC